MTRSSASQSQKSPPSSNRWISAAISVLLGISLLGLAIPRTVAAWASIDAQPALEKLHDGKFPTEKELADGIAGLGRAMAWTSSARRLTDLAWLEGTQALLLRPADPKRGALLAQAEQHLVQGLLANPADGFAWLRLANVRKLRGEQGREIAVALMESLDMAPNMRFLWASRAGMLMSYWQYLTEDEVPEARNQLRTIWAAGPEYRLPLVTDGLMAGGLPKIAEALNGDPEAMTQFEQLKASLIPSAHGRSPN
jgi:hypothetical protein